MRLQSIQRISKLRYDCTGIDNHSNYSLIKRSCIVLDNALSSQKIHEEDVCLPLFINTSYLHLHVSEGVFRSSHTSVFLNRIVIRPYIRVLSMILC